MLTMLTADNRWTPPLPVEETPVELEGFRREGERSIWPLGIRTKHNPTFRRY